MAFLELDTLVKRFGGLAAVDGFSMTLERGVLHALVGPNGCGKSTLFNLITGALPLSAGRVVFDGTDITGWPPHRIALLGLSRKFQVPAVFDELSVEENIAVPKFAGEWLGMWRPARPDVTAILTRIRLEEKRRWPAESLSHGEKQWLEIGMLLAQNARLLLLDEPTAGMTAAETEETAALIREIAAAGDTTVLVIEHDVGFIEQLACPITVMAKGQVLCSGPFAEIRDDPRVVELYFGARAEGTSGNAHA